MLNLFSNPVLVPLLLMSTGIGLWWILSIATKDEKKKSLNGFIDKVFYLLLFAFIINGLGNFSEIVALPYRALILSTLSVSMSFLLVVAYSSLRYFKNTGTDHKTLLSVFQLVSLLGLINQLYYYFLYKSPLLVGLILLFSGLLLFSSTVTLKENKWIYVSLLGPIIHLIVTRNQSVLYFGFVVSPELVALIAIEWSLLAIALLRRQKQSERT